MVAAFITLALAQPSVTQFRKTVRGADLDVISVDLNGNVGVKIGLAQGFPGGDEPFESMVGRIPNVVAAINGAYFDKGTKLPIGDIWTYGKLVRKGLMGTAFCIKADKTMDIRRVQRSRGVNWSEFESVLACGPALVLDGKVDCDWKAEGFRDPHVTGSTTRMGLGYDQDRRLYLVRVNTPMTFEAFAAVMLELGCHEAMNLDSGASRGFFFNGKYIEKPGRKLTNVLAIVKKSS